MMRLTVEETNLLSIYNEGGKAQLTENMTAALPYMDADMRELAERTLSKVDALTEKEYAELDKLILAFCNSPYINKDTYEDTFHELINLFYDLKNNTWDTISDDDVIEFMKNAFNNRCHGSLELLSGEALRLSEHIHCGKTIKTFKED